MQISELKVMRSAAGYYIGRSCVEAGLPFEQPYSRESCYYPSEEAAAADLHTFDVRVCAENEYAYDSGTIPRPKRS